MEVLKAKASADTLRNPAAGMTAQIEAKPNPAIVNRNVTARRSDIVAGMANETEAMNGAELIPITCVETSPLSSDKY